MAPIRIGVKLLAVSVLVLQCFTSAWAQTYPTRFIRYLVADSAGGLNDSIGRIVAAGLSEVLGQQVVVENRAGAGNTIGTAIAAKAPPDGYLLYQLGSAMAVNATLYKNLPFDLVRDFTPITQLVTAPGIVVVHPSLPVKSIVDLVKLAKAKPGAISFASAGAGTPTHMSAELFRVVADVNMLHVPYRGGGEAITSVASGETQVYFAPLASGLPQVRANRVRPIAVTSSKRLPLVPNVPAVAESGYDYDAGFWYGLAVPAKTPKDIVAKVYDAAITVLKRPDTIRRFDDQMAIAVGSKPEEFGAYIKSELEKWGKIIQKIGLTVN